MEQNGLANSSGGVDGVGQQNERLAAGGGVTKDFPRFCSKSWAHSLIHFGSTHPGYRSSPSIERVLLQNLRRQRCRR